MNIDKWKENLIIWDIWWNYLWHQINLLKLSSLKISVKFKKIFKIKEGYVKLKRRNTNTTGRN